MDLAQLLGLGIQNPVDGGDGATTAQFIISIIRNALIIVFAFVTIMAIIYSASAGMKFITAEGASDKVEEAREAIKYVMIGLAVAFIGVIGVFIISGIFSANTNAELSLRCFFGDFHLCSLKETDSNGTCLTNELKLSGCPGGKYYCVGTYKDSSGNTKGQATCSSSQFIKN